MQTEITSHLPLSTIAEEIGITEYEILESFNTLKDDETISNYLSSSQPSYLYTLVSSILGILYYKYGILTAFTRIPNGISYIFIFCISLFLYTYLAMSLYSLFNNIYSFFILHRLYFKGNRNRLLALKTVLISVRDNDNITLSSILTGKAFLLPFTLCWEKYSLLQRTIRLRFNIYLDFNSKSQDEKDASAPYYNSSTLVLDTDIATLSKELGLN